MTFATLDAQRRLADRLLLGLLLVHAMLNPLAVFIAGGPALLAGVASLALALVTLAGFRLGRPGTAR